MGLAAARHRRDSIAGHDGLRRRDIGRTPYRAGCTSGTRPIASCPNAHTQRESPQVVGEARSSHMRGRQKVRLKLVSVATLNPHPGRHVRSGPSGRRISAYTMTTAPTAGRLAEDLLLSRPFVPTRVISPARADAGEGIGPSFIAVRAIEPHRPRLFASLFDRTAPTYGRASSARSSGVRRFDSYVRR